MFEKKNQVFLILPPFNLYIKKHILYIYTMEYYSAIKKISFESVLMRWMKLEPIIQSEVSQKDKDLIDSLKVIHFYEFAHDSQVIHF